MKRDLRQIMRGGYCTRWHANPDLAHVRETLAEHHGRVAQIIIALHPAPSLALIDAALHHDAGEPFAGDLPYPFKQRHPDLAAQHAAVEVQELERLGCAAFLTVKEKIWLAFADRLAGWLHVSMVAPQVLAGADWREEEARLVSVASDLGAHDAVAQLGLSSERAL